MDSYKDIALLFDTNWMAIDRKIKNIILQYHVNERIIKKIKKSGAGQHFTPSGWVIGNAVSSMHDKYKPRKGVRIAGEYEVSFLFIFNLNFKGFRYSQRN